MIIEFKVISQTDKKATLQLSLKSGEFNALDVEVQTSSAVSSIVSIITTDEFDKLAKENRNNGNPVAESASPVTGRISLASTAKINTPVSIYTINVNKASAGDLTAKDVKIRVIECVVSTGSSEQSVGSQVKINYVFGGKIEIAEENIELNYKSSAKLSIDSSYAKDQLKFKTSNSGVATIDSDGNVYAAGKGSATVTVESADGSIKDTCNVTVKYAWWQWIIIIVLFGWIWY